ncbi:hypothetical protein DA717_11770, partial [Piscirickettsiaceae bacterium NZ-RLO2]
MKLAIRVKQKLLSYKSIFYACWTLFTKNYRALIRYLTKYLSSPPIGLSRLDDFDGQKVSYRFNSHHTGQVEGETILALDFIGRMMQHILPKNFHRVRYYGLQATTRFKKHFELIAKSARDMVD